jgi:hypothetical protein
MQETGHTRVPRQRDERERYKKQYMSQSLLYYMCVFIANSG